MATTALSTLFTPVALRVNGCSPEFVQLMLVDAVRDFCRDSWVWRATLADITVVANQADYVMTVPAGSESVVDAVLEVKQDGRILDPRLYTVDLYTSTLSLVSEPATAGAKLSVTVALVPSPTAVAVPDWLARDWRDGIVYGAVALLQAMPDKGWFNPNAAAYSQNRRDQVVARAKENTMRGGRANNGEIMTIPRFI